MALQIGAFNYSQEDYGMYLIYGLPMGDNSMESILKEIDEEIVKMQNELISEKIIKKLQNKFESNYVSNNSSVEGIADNLATYYMLYGDINLINTEIDIYRSITREEIRDVAKKYLNSNQRMILDYVPKRQSSKLRFEEYEKIYIYSSQFIFLTITMQAQDRPQPKPGPAPTININKPQSFVLKNGLKVLVVENHKLPRVSFNLTLDNPPYAEGNKKEFLTF